MSAETRPVLVYDGHCRFCVGQVARLARWVGGRVRFESFHDPGVPARHPGLTREACEGAVHLVEPDGRVTSGAEAILRTLAVRPLLAPLVWLHGVPVLRQLLDAGYRLVARNRFRLQGEACADHACRLHS